MKALRRPPLRGYLGDSTALCHRSLLLTPAPRLDDRPVLADNLDIRDNAETRSVPRRQCAKRQSSWARAELVRQKQRPKPIPTPSLAEHRAELAEERGEKARISRVRSARFAGPSRRAALAALQLPEAKSKSRPLFRAAWPVRGDPDDACRAASSETSFRPRASLSEATPHTPAWRLDFG